MKSSRFALLLLLPGCIVLAGAAESPGVRVLESRRLHLGLAGLAEWVEFERTPPHGPQYDLAFEAVANATEHTLFIRQRDVKVAWNVQLNGRRLGTLETIAHPLVVALRVPPGALKPGENRLTVLRPPSRMLDDIVIGEITLDPRPRDTVLGAATLAVSVTDAERGRALPCRITIVDTEEALAPLHPEAGQPLAARTGVIYTGDGRARVGIAPGTYTVYATRGFEYGLASQRITLAPGESRALALTVRHEVPTPGMIAADSHIHTLTFSKHGDATIEERMYTIAGEGIELAVATEHNHHADFTEPAARTAMGGYFRGVIGNEVTTKAGHFNAFPIRPGSVVPDAQITDWGALLANIRTLTGARVITLNHPRDLHAGFTPLGPANFNPATGALESAARLDCDAIEVVTSAALQSDPLLLYRDWFALLNHGHRVAGIGASDTHHVSEYILGQARTYVAAGPQDPAAIDLDEVWESYRRGRLWVSFGLLTRLTVNERFGVGDLVPAGGGELTVAVEVLGPSWVTADRVELFANGIKIREHPTQATREPLKARVTWSIPRPAHDVHLVAIATGPGVTAPYWETPRPYQAASKIFTPRVIGSTNPIWIDADGDGVFTPARGYASRLVASAGGDPRRLITRLAEYDEPVAIQAADLWRGSGNPGGSEVLLESLRGAPEFIRRSFAVGAEGAR